MQPFAGPGRRERSGSGRRPHGSVSDPRSEREPGGDIPSGDSPQGDRARGPLAGPSAPRRRRGNRRPHDRTGPSMLNWSWRRRYRAPDPPQRTSRTVPSIAAQVTRPSQTPAHAAIHARANAVPIAASHTARVAEVCSGASRRLAPRSPARRAARVDAPVPQASPAAAQDPARIGPRSGARPILLHAPAARKRSASAAAGASVLLSPSAPLRVLLRRGREER